MSDAQEAIIRERREAYRAIFLTPSGEASPMAYHVLRDLRRLCCADRPTHRVAADGSVDVSAMLMNEGRRQVWLRIQQALQIDDETFERMLANARPEE